MSAHLTEEEQIEAFKRWWKENGKSSLATVAICLVGFFGFKGWQDQRQQQAADASTQYQNLLDAIAGDAAGGLTAERKATATHLGQTLRDEHGSSVYASQAGLIMARLAVEEGRLDDAAAQLQWVVDHADDQGLVTIARLRLAQVMFAQDKNDAALALLEQADAGIFTAAYAELRGDILAADRPEEARTAYRLAISHLTAEESGHQQLLEMKLNHLPLSEMAVQGSGE